jgi:hypothetical protein
MDLRHYVRKENVDKLNNYTQFIVCYSTHKLIDIETFPYIIDPNNMKLKFIKLISSVSL